MIASREWETGPKRFTGDSLHEAERGGSAFFMYNPKERCPRPPCPLHGFRARMAGPRPRDERVRMAKTESFDVTTGVDLMEVENAVNQAQKEIGQRYDFKGLKVLMELKKADHLVNLEAPDDMKLNAMWEMLLGKLVRRQVPVKNCQRGLVQKAGGDRVRQEIKLVSGLDIETCRKIVKIIKEAKLKKVQAAIEADKVRVSSPSRDELQDTIALLKGQEFEVDLQFGNYR